MRINLRLLSILFIILLSSLIDIPVNFHIGSSSVSAILTILYALGVWTLLFTSLSLSRWAIKQVLPFVLFLAWGYLSFFWYKFNVPGFQNLLVITAFAGLILLTAQTVQRNPQAGLWIEKVVPVLIWLSAIIAFLDIAYSGIGNSTLLGPRSFALLSLVGISWYLGKWRESSRLKYLIYAGCLVVVIALTLSRTALVISVMLFPASLFEPNKLKRWLQFSIVGAAMVGLMLLVIFNVEAVRSRFFSGDMSLSVGGLVINGMGRNAFWSTTFDSFIQSPIIGKGAGSVTELISTTYPGITHPHNDYLRILHDYGLVGFVLWLWGCAGILWNSWMAWFRERKLPHHKAWLQLAAFLALLAISLTMITDNTMVYPFVMAPLGIILGYARGCLYLNRAAEKAVSTQAATAGPAQLEPNKG